MPLEHHSPGNIDWSSIETLAARQGLSAVVLDGIERHKSSNVSGVPVPDQKMLLQWIGEVMQNYEHPWHTRGIGDGETLVFGIIASRKFSMTKEIFGVYHGRFIATLLSHFDTMITSIEATPLIHPVYDRVRE